MFSVLTRVHAVSTKSPRVDAAEPLLCVLPPRIKPKGGIRPAGVVIHDALIYQSVCHLFLTPSSICLSAPCRGRDKPPKVYLMSRLPCHQVVMTTSILLFCRTHYGLDDSGSGAVNFKLCLKSCVCLYLYPFIPYPHPSILPLPWFYVSTGPPPVGATLLTLAKDRILHTPGNVYACV